ncbi:hypothetical protein A2U01_0046109, partial [Trifolium medium]|nr:hypothetical protein [Trifolium medium]
MSTPTKNDDVQILSWNIIEAVPISIVPPLNSAMEEKRTEKREDSSQASKKSSPSTVGKKSNRKKKSSKSSKSYTMSELYLANLAENVGSESTVPVVETISEGVETHAKISENLGHDIPN